MTLPPNSTVAALSSLRSEAFIALALTASHEDKRLDWPICLQTLTQELCLARAALHFDFHFHLESLSDRLPIVTEGASWHHSSLDSLFFGI